MERGPQISGQSLTLSCFVSGTFDRGAWSRRDGTDISSLPGTIISENVVIFFTSITLRHAGEYIFTVTKGIRRISAILNLEVIGELSVSTTWACVCASVLNIVVNYLRVTYGTLLSDS